MKLNWLTNELRKELRERFEHRYGRVLADEEVEEIAWNLTEFAELYCRWKMNQNETTKSSNSSQ